MKISVVSDLHLEFAPLSGLPGGDLLILAGDIWLYRDMRPEKNDAGSRSRRKRYVKFCDEELSKYARVLIITGNHESYGDLYEEMEEVLRVFLSEHASHATLLHNQVIEIGGVTFLGTTLWSSCGAGNAELQRVIRSNMNDFRLIRTQLPILEGDWALRPAKGAYRIFTPSDANSLHREAVAWLSDQLPKHSRCVVIGHHAPSFLSAGAGHYGDNKLDSAYCSSLDPLIKAHPQIQLWIHGHTHQAERYRIGNTQIVANPRGYFPDEPRSRCFDPAAADFTFAEVDGAAQP
jgi:Icc-related predicted phosphoesterase